MKTQYKISYYNAQGLKNSFDEFHKSAPKSDYELYILGGYMNDVTEVKVEATGLTTDNIEAARAKHVGHILNAVAGHTSPYTITQSELDMLDLGEFHHNGVKYRVTAPNGVTVAEPIGEYNVPFVVNTFYPN